MTEMIITEKPNAAKRIAEALSEGKIDKKSDNTVPYYEITRKGKKILVTCTVGHLYNLAETKKNGWKYPVFDVQWDESSKLNKESAYTKKYLNVLKKLSKEAKEFTIATDFDIEGEVIGLNALRFGCGKKDANRMKFSTLTKPDVVKAYDNKSKTLEWGQAEAGLARHELDWYYGINLSRALTHSIRNAGMFKVLSSGRVQGPALKIIVDRDEEIRNFKPVPYWEIELKGKIREEPVIAWHEQEKFTIKEDAEKIMQRVKDAKKGTVDSIDRIESKQNAPAPFDLTTLQTEAYRCFGINPKNTLAIAQELYTSGLISYPRTSSQKIPEAIGYKSIIQNLSMQEEYKELCKKLLSKGTLKPNEGKKEDPAHPAIYPTGLEPTLDGKEKKVYDLISRRFLATFGDPAIRETIRAKIIVNEEKFEATGITTKEKGWHIYYGPYVAAKEEELAQMNKGDEIAVKKITMLDKETQPPKRYTQASIVREMERQNIGTKSTRAAIVDTLFQRGYVTGKSVESTKLGVGTIKTLEQYCPEIIDVSLTRHFEEEMEEIREKKRTREESLSEAKDTLLKTLEHFKANETKIGEELKKVTTETRTEENTIGNCPTCQGKLMIRKGKFGMFIACDKYPECTTTFKLPGGCLVKATKEHCEHCQHPTINIIRKGKKPQKVCINLKCPSKKVEDEKAQKEIERVTNGVLEKPCPKCDGKLMVRKSVYGTFYGCANFPKCRHTERIVNEPVTKKEVEKKE